MLLFGLVTLPGWTHTVAFSLLLIECADIQVSVLKDIKQLCSASVILKDH